MSKIKYIKIPNLVVPFPDPANDPIVQNIDESSSILLGEGSFGKVLSIKSYDPKKKKFVHLAKKLMKFSGAMDSEILKDIGQEITMIRLVAPFQIYNAYIEHSQNSQQIVLLMEKVEGVDLQKMLKTKKLLTTDEAYELFVYLLTIEGCFETLGGVHRDIKPQNIIYNENPNAKQSRFTLVDFGISCKYIDLNFFPTCLAMNADGTANYLSPWVYGLQDIDNFDADNVNNIILILEDIKNCCTIEKQKVLNKLIFDMKDYLTFAYVNEDSKKELLNEVKGLLRDKEINGILLHYNDMWAIAVTVFRVYVGKYPDHLNNKILSNNNKLTFYNLRNNINPYFIQKDVNSMNPNSEKGRLMGMNMVKMLYFSLTRNKNTGRCLKFVDLLSTLLGNQSENILAHKLFCEKIRYNGFLEDERVEMKESLKRKFSEENQ